jgi:hypothetical protein
MVPRASSVVAQTCIRVTIRLTFASWQLWRHSVVYAVCTFAEVSGIFQLFTSHHHLLIFAPTDCPFNVEDLFMCLHPETIRVHAMPCTKGIKICNILDSVLSIVPSQR